MNISQHLMETTQQDKRMHLRIAYNLEIMEIFYSVVQYKEDRQLK